MFLHAHAINEVHSHELSVSDASNVLRGAKGRDQLPDLFSERSEGGAAVLGFKSPALSLSTGKSLYFTLFYSVCTAGMSHFHHPHKFLCVVLLQRF